MKEKVRIHSLSTKLALLGASAFFLMYVGTTFLGVGENFFTGNVVQAANVAFNDDPLDFDTLRSSNYTEFPGSTDHWASVTDADAGEVVSFAVYYHNTSAGDIATNVVAKLSVPTATGTSITASGEIGAQNAQSVNGTTVVNISSAQTLTYIPGSTKWYPNQSQTPSPFPSGQSGDEFVTSVGVNLGDIASGWPAQGSVVARFQVSTSTSTPPDPDPTPDPTADIKANNSDGPVDLQIGDPLNISWSSSNSVACALTGGIESGVGLSGSYDLNSSLPNYPSTTTKVYIITCNNSSGKTASDSVVVNPPPQPVGSVNISANGSEGPVVLTGESLTLNWTSENVLSVCNLEILGEQDLGGVGSVGSAGPVSAGHPFYPAPNTSKNFTITCEKISGGTISDSVLVSLQGQSNPPIAPSIFSASASGSCGGFVNLQWTIVTNAVYYKVFRDGTLIATTTVSSIVDSGLVPSSSHTYMVRAVNFDGESPDSNTATASASDACLVPPVAPTLTVSTGTQCGGEISLTWNTVSNASYYKITRDGLEVATTSSTTYTDTGLTSGSGYSYSVRAVNSAGQSTLSNTATATASSACVLPPSAPTIIATTSSQCGGKISVSWNAVSNATYYKIIRDNSQIATTTATTYVDSGLIESSNHSYTVKAVNSVGESAHSNISSAVASGSCGGGEPTVPSAPILTATTSPICGGAVDLAWSTSTGATFYKIFRNSNQIATSSQTSYTDSNLSTHTLFYYKVKASNTAGDSAFSNSVSVKSSKACPPGAQVPTVSLVANPTTINLGASSTLTWTSSHATSCLALWTSATSTSGTFSVSPATTTSYSITCSGLGGSATSSATVVVSPPPLPCFAPVITSALTANGKVEQSFTYTILSTTTNATTTTAYSVATSSLPAGLTFAGGTISGIPTQAGTFEIQITATNGCGSDTEVLSVIIAQKDTTGGGDDVTVSLMANPSTLTIGQISTSTLTWTSTNATSCSALWTTATSTSGSMIVSPATTTTYAITCVDNSDSDTASTTITVLSTPQEPPCALPSINSSLSPSGKVGNVFNYVLTGTTSVATTSALQFSVSTTSLPAWLAYSSTTNTFTGTPTTAGTFTIQVTATNTCGSDTENIVISISPADTTGGGGGSSDTGGSSSGGSRSGDRVRNVPLVLGATTDCDYLRDYLRIDLNNDPVEMIKLQVFLREFEGFKDLPVTSVFDQQTFNAVAVFQERYFDDILKPWGHDKYTGYVYILTKKKINEIVCEKAFPLTSAQEIEIAQFRAFLEGLKAQGVSLDNIPGAPQGQNIGGSILSPGGVGMIDGGIFGQDGVNGLSDNASTSATSTAVVRNLRNVAAAVFAGPQSWDDSVNAVLIFLVILLALHLLSGTIVSGQVKKADLSIDARRIRRMFMFVVGLVVATIACLLLSYYEIVLPLLVLIIVISVWLLSLSLGKREVRAVLIPPGTPVNPKEMDKMFEKEAKTPPPLAPFTEPIEPSQTKRSDNFF